MDTAAHASTRTLIKREQHVHKSLVLKLAAWSLHNTGVSRTLQASTAYVILDSVEKPGEHTQLVMNDEPD